MASRCSGQSRFTEGGLTDSVDFDSEALRARLSTCWA
jgi:hypothetical protein